MSTVGIFIGLLVAFIALHRWYVRPRNKARRNDRANRPDLQGRQYQASSPQAGLRGDGPAGQSSAGVHAGGIPEGAGGGSGGAGGSGGIEGSGGNSGSGDGD